MNESYKKSPLPEPCYLTADIEGTGGVIKQRPEDFLVEELPLYEAGGEGEHVYLFIEKREMTTLDVARRIARAFHVRKSDVGYAGLKDKYAITRQHFSVYLPKTGTEDEGLQNLLLHKNMTLLWHDRHLNKLRRGHHGGNRFVVRIRDIEISAIMRAKKALDVLLKQGVPNRFGMQRFGYRNNSHTLGYLLLTKQYEAFMDEMLGYGTELDTEQLRVARGHYRDGDLDAAIEAWPKALRFDRQLVDNLRQGKSAERAVLAVDSTQLNLLISAVQSAAFNDVVERRVGDGTFNRLMAGDLAFIHGNRAVFAVDEATAALENGEGGRISSFEISPSGPMWGANMTQAEGVVGELELEALNRQQLTPEQMVAHDRKISIDGARRPLRIEMKNLDMDGGCDEHGNYIRLAFDLPRGAFATNILDEIMKI
ncbi:tRNA pseudouridine synthase D [Poriferisphaera corsica]|uniref:tRNA pseudouridine synthase D n=1 Tax=Poriferisphaera corsica TaxID=2528020 RepID=A0A517YXN7_9BACT|nr:tRNA pseudouridine(13) synthase TruD [Poriferisphaera corsica]QDU34967.1 tRNA pseudouridine synthase D [Poriferisphaera corsica]